MNAKSYVRQILQIGNASGWILPIMKPRSLYGRKQEVMKATHKPTYNFWVISGCTHMNKLKHKQVYDFPKTACDEQTNTNCNILTFWSSPKRQPSFQTDSVKAHITCSLSEPGQNVFVCITGVYQAHLCFLCNVQN